MRRRRRRREDINLHHHLAHAVRVNQRLGNMQKYKHHPTTDHHPRPIHTHSAYPPPKKQHTYFTRQYQYQYLSTYALLAPTAPNTRNPPRLLLPPVIDIRGTIRRRITPNKTIPHISIPSYPISSHPSIPGGGFTRLGGGDTYTFRQQSKQSP